MGTKNRSTKTAAGVFRCATMALIAMAIVSFASCRKKVTGVSLNKTTLSLIVGDVEQLIATVEPMDAKGKSVTWTSSNANAAIVDNNGNITARASGNAIITVTTNNGNKTATCEVTVTLDPFKDDGVILNGITWATRNVDAPEKFAATPESPG
ncbi:MAG: Ig-like domain-containing protein, partial [Dysgonamonadaceae bacterium]|nr:Ig-like domain-containing protein [Dysgonamonadaceae bacterium]